MEENESIHALPMLGNKRFVVALLAIAALSRRSAVPMSSAELSTLIGVEATMLRRSLGKLIKAGIVFSREGHDGGYVLNPVHESTSLADVYLAVQDVPPSKKRLDIPLSNRFSSSIIASLAEIAIEIERQKVEELEKHMISKLSP
ncbi:HTH-type transcriptional regulator IscR [compost metagenome]